jgi:NO-binding membrane sensor protein with MHYT domain
MPQIDHFSYGFLTPILAYIMSVIGSLLGLLCAQRARGSIGDPRSRAQWLAIAATAIGGTGIWVMHFIAMLGFSISSAPIRYNVPLTLASAAVAIVVVGAGLFTVGFLGPSPGPLVAAGILTGIGVAAMHYTGMAAMHTGVSLHYNPLLVGLSVWIAIAAATAALWFALRIRGMGMTLGAALIMGAAVSGMHYTGMAAMSVRSMPDMQMPSGVGAIQALTPLIVAVSVLTAILLLVIGLSRSEDDRRRDAELEAEIRRGPS